MPLTRTGAVIATAFVAVACGSTGAESGTPTISNGGTVGGRGASEPTGGTTGGTGGAAGAAVGSAGSPSTADADASMNATTDGASTNDHVSGGDGGESFRHPGVLNSKEELDFIKKQVQAGAQPWKLAFEQMRSSSYASGSYAAHPVATVGCGPYSNPDIGCSDEKSDSVAAYSHALLWYLTGNEANAKKAIEIMNAWSGVLKAHDLANTPLQCGWVGSVWPRAAEIIRYTYTGWDAADIDRFAGMLRNAYLPYMVNDFCHNVENWELSFIDAMTQMAVFLDDQKTFMLALGKWREWVPAAYYLTSDGPLPAYPSSCGSKKDGAWPINYWFGQDKFVDGLGEETCRDFGHTQYGLAAMINVAETAHHQGVDLFGEQSKRITSAMEFHAGFLVGQPVPSWLCGGSLSLDTNPTWEIGYNHYHGRLGIDLPFTRMLIDKIRPTGTSRHGADHHMVWKTLSHAEVGN